ncbi:S24 family peptidase [Elizabethkingia ursingii]|jgi:signal peptidase|uniref:S24 family peptidase n=1 Tax=Elizabethkingia ursingii TaxID=1756150 RepID=UPI002012A3F8|nr:S24/S26 family peptidase [Elizabethkingia ursingii]MCL1671867.1 S24/S26 family peptidase [Elizabethkingia ursingii]
MEKKILSKRIIPNDLFFEQVKERLNAGQKVKIPVAGRSMEPFLQNGDLVVLKRFEENDLVNGKIVLAYFNNAYVLHRIVKIKENTITLAGDGNIQQVEVITNKDILAVVIQAYRGEKELSINTLLGQIWYKLRIIRSVYGKIFGIK